MQTALKIDYHGIEPSDSIDSRISEHVERLDQLFSGITACHVGLKPPAGHHRQGARYEVSIQMALRGGREVNVRGSSKLNERYADPLFAVNDAFRRARRQLQDRVRRMRADVKAHEHSPTGTISRFEPTTGHGFIAAGDGHELYFHKNSVVDSRTRDIVTGTRVTFVEEIGDKGPQASTVHILGKHKMR